MKVAHMNVIEATLTLLFGSDGDAVPAPTLRVCFGPNMVATGVVTWLALGDSPNFYSLLTSNGSTIVFDVDKVIHVGLD